MKGLRNIARAISPFTSSKSKEKSADDYSWDLTNVDIEVLMRDFYTTYNPSRIDTIRTILDEYKGEELRMLQQLCNRYKIREEKMQEYIDNAIIVKPLPVITQPVRKPSVRFDTTQDQDSVSTRDNNVDKQYKNNYDIYTDFTWDLTNVDMATALKLIYKELNPQKAPNVATLSTKTYDDFILILQQLCKRHSLSEMQMQEYLDRSPKYSPEFGSGYSSAPSSRSQSISQSDQQSITSSINSSRDPIRSSNNFYLSKNNVNTIPPLHVDTNSDRLMPRDTFQKVRSNGSFPSPQPSIVSDTGSISSRDNYSQSTTKSGDRRNTPTAAIASPPPPPPIESKIVRDDDSDDEDVNSMSRGINEDEDENKVPPNKIGVERRGLTGRTEQADNQGRIVPTNSGIGRKEDRSNHQSNDRVETIVKNQALDARNGSVAGVDRYVEVDNESLKSSMRAAAGSGDRDNDKKDRDNDIKDNNSSKKAFKSDSSIKESTTSNNSTTSSVTSRAVLLDKYQQQQYELEIETQMTLLKAEEGRSLKLKAEIEEEKKKHEKELLRVRKMNENEITKLKTKLEAEYAIKLESEKTIHQEALDQAEANCLRLENNVDAEKRDSNALRKEINALERRLEGLEKKHSDAIADKRDLLRLVDIMSASPMGIKSVLEAYLSKLGDSTGSSAVKSGIGSEGQQLPVSYRIAIALAIKRGQDLPCLDDFPTINIQVPSQGGASNPVAVSVSPQKSTQQDQQLTNSSGKAKKNKKKKDGAESIRDSNNTALDDDHEDPEKSLDEQYQMARKYYVQQEAQEKLAQKIHATNLNMKESQTSSAMELSASRDTSTTVLSSSAATASNDDGIIYDWAEYTDPRTKRKYYYSPSTKKSTWTKPYNFDSIHHRNNMTINAVTNNGNSTSTINRYESPNVSIRSSKSDNFGSKASSHMRPSQLANTTPLRLEELDVYESSSSARPSRSNTPNSQANITTEQYNSMFFATRASSGSNLSKGKWSRSASPSATSQRAPSPALSTVSSRGKQSTSSGNSSYSLWVTAVDPKTNRKYWYNRETKVSTWRQPAELLL